MNGNTLTAKQSTQNARNALSTAMLPSWTPGIVLMLSYLASFTLFALTAAADEAELNIPGILIIGTLLFLILLFVISRIVEGHRKATDRFVTGMVSIAFALALIPLVSVVWTVIFNGAERFDLEYFTTTMRGVTDDGGGALHAIVGTLNITAAATIISVPIGLLTAIYLVEYGKGALAKAITFFVDVMTGIPSIVAGLFAYALFALVFGPGVRMGIAGAVALSVLMIPVVVRSSEEMLKLVPNELREASYALGVPKWLTILKVVLPTSIAGIVTGVVIAIARIIGETAPLLLVAGFTTSMNWDMTDGRMMTLPVFVYDQYKNQGVDAAAYLDRAWAGALALILIVMVLNLIARIVAKIFSPKFTR